MLRVCWAGATKHRAHGQVPWCGECIELLMAVTPTPSYVPRLPVNALEMAPLEPTVPRNLRKPPRREQTSKGTEANGYLSTHL